MILVGCGKSKLDRPAAAKDLYTGSLFRAARRYAESTGETWAIVSALYGLVSSESRIAPYEHRLKKSESEAWGAKVARDLLVRYDPREVVLLMGAEYAVPLYNELSWRGITVKEPLRGLMLGERLSWFKKRTK